MDTVLTWNNLNSGSFTTKIYRGTAPLDRSNLVNPIATLTNGESTYTDSTTVRDTLYYYVFETTIGQDKWSTPNVPIRSVPRKGPGPANLTIGDYSYGYFGSMQAGELLNTADLRAAVGLTVGAISQAGPIWHKWVRNGKVLYVPNGPIVSGISWKTLYDLGLVFGLETAGPYNAGANVNQSAKITLGGDQFRVRLMTGYADDLTKFPPTGVIAEPTETWPNEYNDLIYPLSMWTPDLQRMANVQQATIADQGLTAASNGTGALMQERISATASSAPILRGNSTNSRTGISNRTTGVMATMGYTWWPVLELMDV